jgi:hypothetical protein
MERRTAGSLDFIKIQVQRLIKPGGDFLNWGKRLLLRFPHFGPMVANQGQAPSHAPNHP